MTSLEFSVVGSFLAGLYDAAKLREIAARFHLSGDAFADNAARRAFEVVTAEGASGDADTLARAVAAAVGAESAERMIAGAASTLVDAEANMRQLAD